MEKNKAWVLMENGDPIAVSFDRADIEELFMDLVIEAQFNTFCWNWLYFQEGLEIALKYSKNNDCGYWFTNVVGWHKDKKETCATCAHGTNPLNIGGVKNKCYCSWCKNYTPADFHCKNWEERIP